MISRRNYFSIATLMFIILFLFVSLNDLKDWWNDYAVNTYTETAENYPSRISVYAPVSSAGDEAGKQEGQEDEGSAWSARNLTVLIGESGGGVYGNVVEEWAACSRRGFAAYASLESYRGASDKRERPEMLVIDAACVDWDREEETAFLMRCVEQGTHLVFCTLPDVSVIQASSQVRDLLGIREVAAEETVAAGLHLYGGFLLGGEKVYLPGAGAEGEVVFPGEVDASGKPAFPWYLLTSGTKVYMKGIPEDESVKTEEYPPLIWRKSFGTAYVFAVNGGYMKGIEGLGLLSAMSAEMYPYEIYPVINAQNMILAGYPAFADENRAEMDRIYGRSLKDLFQESIWTNVRTAMNRYRYKITCMMTPQFDYSDGELPDGEQLKYYLKILNEESAEVGLSGVSVSDTPIEQKLEEDGEFIKSVVEAYYFSSFYAGKLSEGDIEKALQADRMSSVATVVREYEEGDSGVVGLLSESVVSQKALDIGFDYTYRGDFQVRCLETALGYLSISFDMERVAYPKSEEDAWVKISAGFGTTLDTYGRMFSEFDRTTVSESGNRIWSFLTLRYSESRKGDTIRLQALSGDSTAKWFLLRLHNEAVRQVEGGSWKRLEEGAYLIEAEKEEVLITLGPADERHYR